MQLGAPNADSMRTRELEHARRFSGWGTRRNHDEAISGQGGEEIVSARDKVRRRG